MFAMLGMSNYGSRTIAQCGMNALDISHKFSELYAIQLITSAICIFTYGIFAVGFAENKRIALIVIVQVAAAVFDISWLYFGMEEYKITAIRSATVKLITTVGIFVLVKSQRDLWIYVLLYCSNAFLSNIVLWPFLKKRGIHLERVNISSLKPHVKPLFLLFLPVIGVSLYKYMDKIMLGLYSITETGFYESSEKIANVPVCMVAALGVVMLSRISRLVGEGESEGKIGSYLKKSLLFAVGLSSVLAGGIIGVGKEFVPLFYGEGFESCESIITILMISTIFMSIANVTRTQYLIPRHIDWVYIVSIFAGAAINLIANSILIPKYGAIGAASATVLAEASVCLVQVVYMLRKTKIGLYLMETLPLVIFGAIMGSILRGINLAGLNSIFAIGVKALIGSALYFFLTVTYLGVIHTVCRHAHC
jgi:O-antigen/teichoic acid export membrane protein